MKIHQITQLNLPRGIAQFLRWAILQRRKETAFLVFASFLTTFSAIRSWVYAMHQGIIPQMFVYIYDIHVHHLNFGIFIMAIVGFIALTSQNYVKRHMHGVSLIYGIGLGLTFDEFGMWLLLEDNYWARQSYDAIIIIALLLFSVIYFRGFWRFILRVTRIYREELPSIIPTAFRP